MSSPVSIGDVLQLVHSAVEIYKQIKEAPQKIERIGQAMARIESYLTDLDCLVGDQSMNSITALQPKQTAALQATIDDVKQDAGRVYHLLDQYKNKTLQGGINLRFDFLNNAAFSLGGRSEKLDALEARIDKHLVHIDHYINLLTLLRQVQASAEPSPAIQPSTSLQPSMSPAPKKTDYRIIFLDFHNTGRSKVAEVYTKLVREWTLRCGGQWRVEFAHSAGLLLRNRSDCADIIESIPMPGTLVLGDKPPNPVAMDSLFDNKFFHQFKKRKAEIRSTALARRSRGVTKNLFSLYDYIFIFNGRHEGPLRRLREVLVKDQGPSAAPEGKRRIVRLPQYGKGNLGAIKRPDESDPTKARERWNTTTSNIKVAFKDWLTKELEWERPSWK